MRFYFILWLGTGCLLGGFSHAHGAPEVQGFESQVTADELRRTLVGLARFQSFQGDDEIFQRKELPLQVGRLIRSYRTRAKAVEGPLFLAPYPGMIVGEQFDSLFQSAFESEWKKNYVKEVFGISKETLLDALMELIADHGIPSDAPQALKDAEKMIGPKTARKVLAGRDTPCILDESDRIYKVSLVSKLRLKAGWGDACFARKTVYNLAKKDLIEAKRNPVVIKMIEKEFTKKFPAQFREGFLKQVDELGAQFPQLISQKFRGAYDALLWGERTPLIENLQSDGRTLPLSDFAWGLQADVAAARLLIQSDEKELRGMAAPLFYAAANRLLVFTGGESVGWDGKHFARAPGDAFDPKHLRRPPRLQKQAFGGWGLEAGSFSPWDWEKYDPVGNPEEGIAPQPLRLFPAVLGLGSRWVPRAPVAGAGLEKLEDMALLAEGLLDFLFATAPGEPLAQFLGSAEEVEKILDPQSPMIFPQEGRLLAVGMLAGVLKNLILPRLGHFEQTEVGTTVGTLGLRFHGVIDGSGPTAEPTSTASVVRSLLAAWRFLDLIQKAKEGDSQIPQEFLAQEKPLRDAIEMGAYTVGVKGQEGDGGFRQYLGQPQTSGRNLMDTVMALELMVRAYELTRSPSFLLHIRGALQFLDGLWGDRMAPLAEEGTQWKWVFPGDLWRVVRVGELSEQVLNDSASTAAFHSSGPSRSPRWFSRLRKLKYYLNHQLLTPRGPEGLSP